MAAKFATSPESPATVVQVGRLMRAYVERLGSVWVEGQVAEVSRRAGAKGVFLTLRDGSGSASIRLYCRREVFDSQPRPIVEGLGVVVCARPAFYVPRGTISFEVNEFRLLGLGELLARIEALRQALAAEGLFAPERKRRPPFLPRRIGLVTARGSDAEQDVLQTARRRWATVSFEIAYATMQGPRTVTEVIEALRRLERHPEVDVIVITRGGGSVEDLLPFSDEALLRAVHALRIPVVSAIGHDQDQPLLDLAADLRASTPTDAASRIVPDETEERARVHAARARARDVLRRYLDREAAVLAEMRARRRRADPRRMLEARAGDVAALRDRARRSWRVAIDRSAAELRGQLSRARALSPLATLERGYAVLQLDDGHVVTSVAGVAAGRRVTARVVDGRILATTTSVEDLRTG